MLDKPKARTKRQPRQQPTFDYVSPRSLETCGSILAAQHGRTDYDLGVKWDKPEYRLAVEVRSLDADTCEFRLHWKSNLPETLKPKTYMTCHGYLKRWENNATYITGFISLAGISYYDLLRYGLLFVIPWVLCVVCHLLILPGFPYSLLAVIFGLLYLLRWWWQVRQMRLRLLHIIKVKLDIPTPFKVE